MEGQSKRQHGFHCCREVPEETYLDITHDLAVLLNDDNLRILPIVGMGGAQNVSEMCCT